MTGQKVEHGYGLIMTLFKSDPHYEILEDRYQWNFQEFCTVCTSRFTHETLVDLTANGLPQVGLARSVSHSP